MEFVIKLLESKKEMNRELIDSANAKLSKYPKMRDSYKAEFLAKVLVSESFNKQIDAAIEILNEATVKRSEA